MIYTNRILLILLLLLNFYVLQAQETNKPQRINKIEPNNAVLINPYYIAQFPYGNMGDRFGFNSQVGLGLNYKLKHNIIVGAEGGFLFGSKVRETGILQNIATNSYQHISQDGILANVKLQERGFVMKINVGKLVAFSPKHPDAGLLFITSIGFIQHKIAIDVNEATLPQLSKTYRKGYDRLSNGPVISQFIGGMWMERRKFVSVYGGLQFDLGFTQNRRPMNFDTMTKDTQKRLDMFLGIKVGWIIPVFTQTDVREY
jgi:hypothetical protein